MRLIDADALLKHKSDHETISTHLIWNAPTVDTVPVIRCKDCKYKQHMQIRYGEQMWEVDYCGHERMRETSISASSVEADDFCSWAERKEE